MKKLITILLALCMIFGIAACTAQPAQSDAQTDEQTQQQDDTEFMERQREYAKLLVEKGVGLKEGQKILINAQAECYEFARLCVEAAYAAGAADVIVSWSDTESTHQKYLYADEEVLSEYPDYLDELYGQCLEEMIPVLSLRSVHPGNMSDVDSERLALAYSATGENSLAYDKKVMNNEIPWVIASVPNEEWATLVFPELSTEEAMAKLWDAILDTVYVSGEGDGEELWSKHIDRLNKNAAKLNEMKFKTLHYTNSLGTDLTIELPENAVWCIAEMSTPDGSLFTANMPSEEVFTSPLANSANGVVYASMPLELGGTVVKDIKFTVKDGKIVESSASSGLDVLNSNLDYDEGARYFGEIALVPYDSPISQQGILYYDTLFDENASCHIAFGDSFAECYEGGVSMTKDELVAAGLNSSDNHVDFMVGTADMKIVGTTYDGEEIVIFENGNFSDSFLKY